MSGTMTMLVPDGDATMDPGWYVATSWPDEGPKIEATDDPKMKFGPPTLSRPDIIWAGPYETRADAVSQPENV